MKGAKSNSRQNNRQPYGNTERKNGKRSEKSTKLDRKSSRGMIYENEELRLRTININAEVERGQSDIKRLRRENEHLRREIWTLRDECDRLNKRFKAKLVDNTHGDHGGCSVRGSGASGGCTGRRGSCDGMHSNSNSDDSDSCDACKCNNDEQCIIDDYKYTPNDCCYDGSCKLPPLSLQQLQQQQQLLVNEITAKLNNAQPAQNLPTNVGQTNTTECGANATNNCGASSSSSSSNSDPQQLHSNFDHLSVVSEETMSNSEMLTQTLLHDNVLGSQMMLPSLVGPLTPLTPVETVANELNDLQSMAPPLSYFENIIQQHTTYATSPESSNTTNSGKTVLHTNGWDYNLQSPFTQRKYPSHSSSSSSSIPRSPSQPRYLQAQTLSTFGGTAGNALIPPVIVRTEVTADEDHSTQSNVPSIETVAITTLPASGLPAGNSPKHFFAPLKPRLKINTSLANKNLLAAPVPVPIVPQLPTKSVTPPPLRRDPPDIFVANALASPYQRPTLAVTTTATTTLLPPPPTQLTPPPLPQRHSPQVSPRLNRRYNHQHHNHHHHHHHHHQQQQQEQQHHQQHHHQHHKRHVVTADIVLSKDAAEYDDDVDYLAVVDVVAGDASATAATATTNTKGTQPQQVQLQQQQQQQQQKQQNFSPILTKLNEPIYATAKKRCNNLISAPAVTQPLMTTAIVVNTPPSHARKSNVSSESKTMTSVGPEQTDSANLEAILNDIETISEDILAIQLEKNKSREDVSVTMMTAPEVKAAQRKLQQNDKNKKPYRSEMNLMLAYDGTNPVITPTTATTTTGTSTAANGRPSNATGLTNDNNNNNHTTTRRTRSLEREHTESPSPNPMPDPMVPFPPNRTYIGFDQVNAAANLKRPPLPPSQIVAQILSPSAGGNMAKIGAATAKPGTPIKVLPPVPPVRAHPPPPPLSLRNYTEAEEQPAKSSLALTPNKSHLFTSLANVAAISKRAQFAATPPHLSRSLDTDGLLLLDSSGQQQREPSPQLTEEAKKKMRRVSIVCGDNSSSNNEPEDHNATATSTATTAAISTTPQGSCTDLKATNPVIMHLRQTSNSTPNSPHSVRRSNSDHPTPPHTQSYTPGVASQTQNQLLPNCSALALHRKSSQDSTGCLTAAAVELASAAAAAVASRSKCSRRHSDGTVTAGVQRISSSSSHHHHHHGHGHRHHHQHSASLISNNPHHSHQSHAESNHDSADSISDRNSSLGSSRDSSTSFSMRSQRRKISVSSHTGGKIPWCGCWGNGCL